jgi:hypothetical protein
MKKHKANELLHQASMLATTVSAQIMSGKEPTSIQTFGSGSEDFSSEVSVVGEQFLLKANNVELDVCKQLESMKGGTVRDVSCDTVGGNDKTTAIFKFNNNLSTESVSSDFDNDEEGCEASGHKYCDNDTCVPATEECPIVCDINPEECLSGQLLEGECACAPADEGVQCRSYTTNECGKGMYCDLLLYQGYCDSDDRIKGSCVKITSRTPITTADGTTYMLGPSGNWYKASSWCKGNGMELVTGSMAGYELNKYVFNAKPLYTHFGQWISFWTGHFDKDRCSAYAVDAAPSYPGIQSLSTNHAGEQALCMGTPNDIIKEPEDCLNEDVCKSSGYKWCSGLSYPVCQRECCVNVTLTGECQIGCDSSTGSIINREDGLICKTSDNKDGKCNAGICEEIKNDYTGVECADFENNTECGGVGSGWYCVFKSPSTGTESGSGVCQPVGYIGEYKSASYESVEYTMSNCNGYCPNWWTAQSWCKGIGKRLVTLEDLGCPAQPAFNDGCSYYPLDELRNLLYQNPAWVMGGPQDHLGYRIELFSKTVGWEWRYSTLNNRNGGALCREL